MIVAEHLTKRFPGRRAPAVDDLPLEVRDGEILGLVGLNGAGKTTTMRMAAGVSIPSSGRILVDGVDIVREKRAASKRVAWVPELFPYEPTVRALPLLVYFAGFYGLSSAEATRHARERLAAVGLGEDEQGLLRNFSQGMRKRFSLASAMISDPANLLLDEILNGLDPAGIAFVRNWVQESRRDRRAVLLSSHQLTELEALADRVAFVHQGRLLRTIDRAELARAGTPAFRFTIRNLDPAALAYLSSVGTVRADGATVWLSRPTTESHDVTAELVRRGYQVAECRVETTSLEAYFLELIGEAR